MLLKNEGGCFPTKSSPYLPPPPAGKHFVHQSAFMKQLPTGCLIFSFIQKKTHTFFIESLLYAWHSLGPQNRSGTEEETGSGGFVTWSQRQNSNLSPPDFQNSQMGFLKMDVTRGGGVVQEGTLSYSMEDLGAEVSHSWSGFVHGPSLLNWLSTLGVGGVWLGPDFLAQIAL